MLTRCLAASPTRWLASCVLFVSLFFQVNGKYLKEYRARFCPSSVGIFVMLCAGCANAARCCWWAHAVRASNVRINRVCALCSVAIVFFWLFRLYCFQMQASEREPIHATFWRKAAAAAKQLSTNYLYICIRSGWALVFSFFPLEPLTEYWMKILRIKNEMKTK